MAKNIKHKKSSSASQVPAPSSIEVAELAINLADAIIYTKDESGTILNLSGAPELHSHSISDVTGLQTALDNKVDDSQVLTNVPVGAVFTDTVYDDSSVLKDSDVLTPVAVDNKLVTESDIAGLGGSSSGITTGKAIAMAIVFG